MMETLALAIQRNNEAVDGLIVNNNNNTSERMFRECLHIIKKSLNNSKQMIAGQQHSVDPQPPSSSSTSPRTMPVLVQPADQSLEAPHGDPQSCESFFLAYTYRRPLYFVSPSSFFEKHYANFQNDPIWLSYLIQLVTAVVLFNMGLCYQHRSTIASSQYHICNNSSKKEAALGNAHSLYHASACLLRDVAGVGRCVSPLAAVLSEELEVIIWNNLLQVAMELGDVDRGQEAAQALHELCSWKRECILLAGHQPVLVDNSVMEQVLTNILSWRMATLPIDSAEQNATGRCTALSMYAAAA